MSTSIEHDDDQEMENRDQQPEEQQEQLLEGAPLLDDDDEQQQQEQEQEEVLSEGEGGAAADADDQGPPIPRQETDQPPQEDVFSDGLPLQDNEVPPQTEEYVGPGVEVVEEEEPQYTGAAEKGGDLPQQEENEEDLNATNEAPSSQGGGIIGGRDEEDDPAGLGNTTSTARPGSVQQHGRILGPGARPDTSESQFAASTRSGVSSKPKTPLMSFHPGGLSRHLEDDEDDATYGFGNGRLVLPDCGAVINEMRNQAETELFKIRDPDDFLDVEQYTVEVGTMHMPKDISAMEEEKENEEDEQQQEWDNEIIDKIDDSRDAVTTHQSGVRLKNTELQWRLREEEVAARERLAFEHQALEARLLNRLKTRTGKLQHVAHDSTSWTVEWSKSPQEVRINITTLRGLRAKVREGYYVLLVSIVDRIGGRTIRFSTGENNKDCSAAVCPIRYVSKSGNVDFFVDKQLQLLCPAAILLRTHAAIVIELWQLKVGKYDPVDKVVGWGVWPLVNKDFLVVEGKFKAPMLKGAVDQGVDTYRELTQAVKENLSRWLCNVYFEITLQRGDHDKSDHDSIAQQQAEAESEANQLRLKKTADDFRSLTVAKLPPRLFFDEVALDGGAGSGLRRRHLGNEDMRALNQALWEKRANLEEEREALQQDLHQRKSRSFTGDNEDDDEINDWRIRKDLAKMKHTFRKTPMTRDAEDEEREKCRDSHVLVGYHHQAVISQREFFFMGRRYRDKFQITEAVVLYDLGVNFGGPWDKTKVVMNVVFLALGFMFRLYVHSVGLYLWLFYLDVPTTKNDWSAVVSVDIRFDFTTRFYPKDSTLTMLSGMVACIWFFMFFGISFFALIIIFDRLPYWITRLLLWIGVMIVFDPLITAAYDTYQGDYESGEVFLLYNQLVREEESALSGILLTMLMFGCLSFFQTLLVYLYIGACHLNGRANDVYTRLTFPDSSFFCPHDMEVSETELKEIVKLAKVWRTDQGDIKRVRVMPMSYHHTCFFRARLFKLLSTFTNDPEVWVSKYIDAIPLRRPYHARKLIEDKLGKFELGSDILLFLRRNFPHLTVTSKSQVGDREEDYYYEAELVKQTTSHSATVEDDTEMREMLKAFFTSQIYDEKPVEWDYDNPEHFIIKDKQLLADLIFFETSTETGRAIKLAMMLSGSCDGWFSVDAEKPDTWGTVKLENFHREKPIASTQGPQAEGSIIHIVLENPTKLSQQLARAFVVTPFGTIVEPKTDSYTCLQAHTADHVEFWAMNALQLGKQYCVTEDYDGREGEKSPLMGDGENMKSFNFS